MPMSGRYWPILDLMWRASGKPVGRGVLSPPLQGETEIDRDGDEDEEKPLALFLSRA